MIFQHSKHPNIIYYFLLPIFFIYLADSIQSFTFPLVVQSSLNSNSLMGLIIAISSVAGIMCDVLFPSILRNKTWKFIFLSGVIIATLFPILTFFGVSTNLTVFFICASIAWGIYFEMLAFSLEGFVSSEEKRSFFSRAWGILYTPRGLITVSAPIIGTYLLTLSDLANYAILLGLVICSFVIFLLIPVKKFHPTVKKNEFSLTNHKSISIRSDIFLIRRLLPVVLTTFMFCTLETYFWIFGGLFGKEYLSEDLYWLPIVVFNLSFFAASVFAMRKGIYRRKKFIAQILLLFSGISLLFAVILQSQAIVVFALIGIAGFLGNLAYLLNTAVFSDIINRTPEANKQIIAINRGTISAAYIAGPLLLGIFSDKIGYLNTLGVLSVVTIISTVILIVITPKKIRISHRQLKT